MKRLDALTAERAREVLAYDPETGFFRWRVTNSNRALLGMQAGNRTSEGYYRIGVDGHNYKAHRLAWLIVHGEWPADQIDHINGDRSDNRVANLRVATQCENSQNMMRRTPEITGVRSMRGKWQARIKANGELVHLGTFSTPDEANAAYRDAKRRLHTFAPEVRQNP